METDNIALSASCEPGQSEDNWGSEQVNGDPLEENIDKEQFGDDIRLSEDNCVQEKFEDPPELESDPDITKENLYLHLEDDSELLYVLDTSEENCDQELIKDRCESEPEVNPTEENCYQKQFEDHCESDSIDLGRLEDDCPREQMEDSFEVGRVHHDLPKENYDQDQSEFTINKSGDNRHKSMQDCNDKSVDNVDLVPLQHELEGYWKDAREDDNWGVNVIDEIEEDLDAESDGMCNEPRDICEPNQEEDISKMESGNDLQDINIYNFNEDSGPSDPKVQRDFRCDKRSCRDFGKSFKYLSSKKKHDRLTIIYILDIYLLTFQVFVPCQCQ